MCAERVCFARLTTVLLLHYTISQNAEGVLGGHLWSVLCCSKSVVTEHAINSPPAAAMSGITHLVLPQISAFASPENILTPACRARETML